MLLEDVVERGNCVHRIAQLKRDIPLLRAMEDDLGTLEAGLRGKSRKPARLLAYYLDLVEIEEALYSGGPWLEVANKMIPHAVTRMEREVAALERLKNSELGGRPIEAP